MLKAAYHCDSQISINNNCPWRDLTRGKHVRCRIMSTSLICQTLIPGCLCCQLHTFAQWAFSVAGLLLYNSVLDCLRDQDVGKEIFRQQRTSRQHWLQRTGAFSALGPVSPTTVNFNCRFSPHFNIQLA